MNPGSVLVDTSVWIQYLRGNTESVNLLNALMATKRIVISGQIVQEVLQGSRDAGALAKLEREMSIWDYEPETPEDFVAAARTFAKLRWKGITIPPSDCLIAALALRCNLELCAQDEHFGHIPNLARYTP